MVAPLPLPLVLRDVWMAAGLGFLLGLCYRMMRLLLGNSKLACFVCDGSIFVIGAVLYRSAAAGVFASGVMRWYTLGSLLLSYGLVQKIFYAIFLRIGNAIHLVLRWPFFKMQRYILCPMKSVWGKYRSETAKKQAQWQKTRIKTKKQGLPNPQEVLYNSNQQ